MNDCHADMRQFRQIFQDKPEELWSQPFTERALRMHSLNTLDLVVLGGGLFPWYENPSGLEGSRTIAALHEIGESSLANLLSDTLMRLEQTFGPRNEIRFDYEFDDQQIANIREISREFERQFHELCAAVPENFFQRAVAWWNGKPFPSQPE